MVLGFKEFRPKDPIFNAENDISMMSNGRARVTLVQVGETQRVNRVKQYKSGQLYYENYGQEGVLWRDRAIQGHFALETNAEGFKDFHSRLKKGLLVKHGAKTETECWFRYDDYGVQQSVFFRDLDLNEIELCYWSEPQEGDEAL